MSRLNILIIVAIVFFVCSPVWAADWSESWSVENNEEADVERPYEGGSFLIIRSYPEYDFTDENLLEMDLRPFCSLPSVSIDVRYAPVYLLLAILRR
jgi:hypothetical protein